MFEFFIPNLIAGFGILWYVIREGWWIIFPPLILYVAAETWKFYLAEKNRWETEWIILEIKIPRDVLKSPEAMERVFAGLHGPYDPPQMFKDYYLESKIRLFYSFEMVGVGGDMRFYVYCPKSWRNLVEAQMYAQYGEVTISEAKDYAAEIPKTVPDSEYDLWGMEMQFLKEDAYPILTYKDFTTLTEAKLEEVKVDPLSAFSESFAKLRPGEEIWFQILMRPCGPPGEGAKDKWKDEGQTLVDKLAGRPEKPKPASWWAGIGDVVGALFEEVGEGLAELGKPMSSSGERGLGRLGAGGGGEKKEDKKEPSKLQHVTPGEKDVIAAIERKIGKLGYECIVRIVYVARREVFDMSVIGSLFGILKQFNTQNANGFRPIGDTLTKKKDYLFGFFSSKAYQLRIKRGLMASYVGRSPFWDVKALFKLLPSWAAVLVPSFVSTVRSKSIVLNIEELATLFHFPGRTVSSPTMPRMEAKSGEPPVNLPMG